MRCVIPAVAGLLLLLHVQAARSPLLGPSASDGTLSPEHAVALLTGLPFVVRGYAFQARCSCCFCMPGRASIAKSMFRKDACSAHGLHNGLQGLPWTRAQQVVMHVYC